MVLRSTLLFLFVLISGLTWAQPCGTITLANADTASICLGDRVTLRQTNTLTGATVTFSSASGFISTIIGNSATVSPTASGFIRVTASNLLGCTVSDSIFIDVDRLVVPELIDPITVCSGETVNILKNRVTDVGNTNYQLFGNPDTIIRSGTNPNYSIEITQDTVLTLVSRSDNGACIERNSVRINVTPGTFQIQQDTIFSCLGVDSVVLSVNAPGVDPAAITWRPARFNSTPTTGATFVVRPVADITYFVEAVVNGCNRIDSVAVRLDSLPQDLSMTIEPFKDPFCQGDTFYVRSPIFDAGDFPVITHQWTESVGIQSPIDLYNAVFTGQDTTTLTRVTTNGACVDTTSVDVNVVKPPVVTFSPVDPVCPDVEVQIQATFESGMGTLEWEDPNNTLSCTDCLDPIATVQTTTEYTITVDYGSEDCSSELTYTLTIEPAANPSLTQETQLCLGDSLVLITGDIDPDNTYRITGGGQEITNPRGAVTPTETTTYTIETTSECGVNSQSLVVTVLDNYSVTASGPTTICADETLTLSAAVDPGDITGTYNWTLPNGVSRTGQSITENNPASGTYTVTFTDARGCTSATDEIEVTVIGQTINPIITGLLADGTSLINGGGFFAGNSVVLSVTNVPDNIAYTYNWSGNYNPATATGEQITVTVPRVDDGLPEPLVYTVTLTTVEGGCAFEATIVLNIEQSQVQSPDFFTPDSDGRNDRFRLFFNGTISDYTMIVYDRWGQKVFTSDDPLEGWDGTKNGTPQNADTYLYKAKFRQDGVELERGGQFTLLR